MKRSLIFLILLLIGFPQAAVSETIKLCVDERNWYPFTFAENNTGKGMHVEIVKKALKDLGHDLIIEPQHRNRNILACRQGDFDGIISIAYDDSLESVLDFPPAAEKETESPWRIMQVDHMVITYIYDKYAFKGDIQTLPNPVRITFAESITNMLKEAGLEVEETSRDRQNFEMLVRDENGCVITTSIVAENMNKEPKFKNKFKIHPTPLISQSYYLAFSEKSSLPSTEKLKIWEKIVELRGDYVYMLKLFAQY